MQPNGISTGLGLGIGMVLFGVVVSPAALFRYVRLTQKFDRGEGMRGPSWLAVALAAGLALIGALVSLWLLAL